MKMFGIHKCRKDDRGNWQRYVDKDYLWINFDLVKSVQIEYESTNVYPTYEDQYFKLVLEFNDNDYIDVEHTDLLNFNTDDNFSILNGNAILSKTVN